jgi:hypothetical protein
MTDVIGIPSWLEAALVRTSRRPVGLPDEREWLVRAEPGEIRLAQPMDQDGTPSRLVLVLESYPEEDPWVNACLIAQATEVAGDRDVRLDLEETSLPFSVLAETDVIGPLLTVQLGPVLGAIGEPLLNGLKGAVYGSWDPALVGRRGIPIMSRAEARWRLKEDEIATMHSLSSHCLEHLVEGEAKSMTPTATVDPVLFDEETLVTPDVALLKVVALATKEGLNLSTPAEALRSDDRLRDWIAALGPDAWRALEPIWHSSLQQAEAAPPGPARSGEVSWTPEWPAPSADALARRLAVEAERGRRTFRVVTGGPGWNRYGRAVSEGGVFALDIEQGGRVQVKPELVDEVAA